MGRISESDLNYILTKTQNIWKENSVCGSKILITGATGFFGKWLLESLLFLNKSIGLDCEIFALSRDPEKFLHQHPFFRREKSISWIKGDIRLFENSASDFDYIIHAATDADAKLINEDPLLMLDTITEGTRRILHFAGKQPGLKAILLLSSGAVYGRQPESIAMIKETDSFNIDINNINSSYAEGKRVSELYGSIYTKLYDLPVKIARCFAFVGPYLPLEKHFAIGNFIHDGLKGQKITVTGDGSQLRSYMYASDLAIWLYTILLNGNTGVAYNVGSDDSVSIKELAEIIAGFFPAISVDILNQVRNTDRNQNYIPDVSRAKSQFNFGEGISLRDAIYKTIKFYEQYE
jgi:nucleoside-diphosphate-sugar epimerase